MWLFVQAGLKEIYADKRGNLFFHFLMPGGINNHIRYKMRHEIANPFPNFNGAVSEWKSNFSLNWVYAYLSWIKYTEMCVFIIISVHFNYIVAESFKLETADTTSMEYDSTNYLA